MSAVEVLKAAKELIADPARWCQESYAMDDTGVAEVSDGAACRFCAVGARLRILASEDNTTQTWTATGVFLESSAHQKYGSGITYVNDHVGHEAVMKCYDRAIELAQEAEHAVVQGQG